MGYNWPVAVTIEIFDITIVSIPCLAIAFLIHTNVFICNRSRNAFIPGSVSKFKFDAEQLRYTRESVLL